MSEICLDGEALSSLRCLLLWSGPLRRSIFANQGKTKMPRRSEALQRRHDSFPMERPTPLGHIFNSQFGNSRSAIPSWQDASTERGAPTICLCGEDHSVGPPLHWCDGAVLYPIREPIRRFFHHQDGNLQLSPGRRSHQTQDP
jgi:hypothetical protein